MRPRRASVSTLASIASYATSTSLYSTRASTHTVPNPQDIQEEFPVLAAFDFVSNDPAHLTFKKGEIIEIIKTEETGWWAGAIGEKVGWVPMTYVQPLSDDMAEMLRHVSPEFRQAKLEAELLSDEVETIQVGDMGKDDGTLVGGRTDIEKQEWGEAIAQISNLRIQNDQPILNEPLSRLRVEPQPVGVSSHPSLSVTIPPVVQSTSNPTAIDSDISSESPSTPSVASTVASSEFTPSPITPTPPFTFASSPTPSASPSADTTNTDPFSPRFRKPVTGGGSSNSTPNLNSTNSASLLSGGGNIMFGMPPLFHPMHARFRSESVPASVSMGIPRDSPSRLSTLTEASTVSSLPRTEYPWFLHPFHTEDTATIKLDADGYVQAGTIDALVERLTLEHRKASQDLLYRRIFLSTYKSFSNAEEVFFLLAEKYQMEHPNLHRENELALWKERKQGPTQIRILNVFKDWVEQHYLVQDDPDVADRVIEFLSVIKSPPPQSDIARGILQTLQQHYLSPVSPIPSPTSTSPLKKRRSKPHKGDPIRIDSLELAQHLTLIEARLFSKVLPSECVYWSKNQRQGDNVRNLMAFCETSDRLAGWVKSSVLGVESLGKRANLIDHWIRVAEKCRQMNNISSMSALVAALTHTLLTQLQLTWAHVGKQSRLEPLTKLADPSGSHANYRNLYQTIEGPCIPYIGMYLTSMVHLNNQYKDTTIQDSQILINFVKRQRLWDVMDTMLHFQSKPFTNIPENPSTMDFIQSQLLKAKNLNETTLWEQSHELVIAEVEHADIRKGLEAAGF